MFVRRIAGGLATCIRKDSPLNKLARLESETVTGERVQYLRLRMGE